MSGYLPLPRDFFTLFLWDEKRSFSKAEAYLDLLQFAAFAPSERFVSGKFIRLDEGECIASVRFLAERWGWGKDKAAQFMKLLDDRRLTKRETRQGETIVILCRYKDWQCQTDVPPDSKPDTDPDRDQTGTRTNKNKEKKMKKREQAPSLQFSDEMPTGSAEDLQAIIDRINKLTPPWTRMPHFSYLERQELLGNAQIFASFDSGTWQMLEAYLHHDFEKQPLGGLKHFQPDARSMFLRAITDIITHAENWARKTKWKATEAA